MDIDIKRNGSRPSTKGNSDWFTGSVRVDPLFQRRREFVGLIAGVVSLWPMAKAHGKVPVIGYLHFATPDYQPAAVSFLQGLADTGFVEGKDFSVAYRWAEGHYMTACRRWLPSWSDSAST